MGMDTGGRYHAPSLGAPTGRFDSARSAVTGQLLNYFTPDPLSTLLTRRNLCTGKDSSRETNLGLALLLLRPASLHAPTRSFDGLQARRLGHVALEHTELRTKDALIRLALEISPRVSGLREEIVFAGATNASNAGHVFAPHEVLPSHIAGLSDALSSLPTQMDAAVAASIAGFYCVHLHPFLDGNGRWARALSVYAGTKSGSANAGLISAIYQTYFKDELTRFIWPHTRNSGFDLYIDIGNEFEAALRQGLEGSEAAVAADQLLAILKGYAPSKRVLERFAVRLFTEGECAMAHAKEEFCLSQKRIAGLEQAIQAIEAEQASKARDSNLFDWFTQSAVRNVKEAKENVLRKFE